MVDQLIYSADDAMKHAKEKVSAFASAWVERGSEFINNSMPESATHAATLVREAKDVCSGIEGLLEHNKKLLTQDKMLDKDWDRLKKEKLEKEIEKDLEKKMYA